MSNRNEFLAAYNLPLKYKKKYTKNTHKGLSLKIANLRLNPTVSRIVWKNVFKCMKRTLSAVPLTP